MDREKKEQWIDKLLIYSNNEIDKTDKGICVVVFDFSTYGEDRIAFMQSNKIHDNELEEVLNSCINQKYLSYYAATPKHKGLRLTEYGQGRAISAERSITQKDTSPANIQIGTIYNQGPAQIGNHNTQNIEIVLKELIDKINDADVPDEQKREAKSRLKAFLEHPLVGTALGLGGSAIMALLGV